MDAFAELARIADEIRLAIDRHPLGQALAGLRRDLDLAFARVLDREEDDDRRDEFVAGYAALCRSLDDLERLAPGA
jgi:hypothetical protein